MFVIYADWEMSVDIVCCICRLGYVSRQSLLLYMQTGRCQKTTFVIYADWEMSMDNVCYICRLGDVSRQRLLYMQTGRCQ